MTEGRLERQLDAVAALADPTRRSLYLHVARAGVEVGRDEAAAAAKISRSLAAFHLDRLVEDGLLEAGYRRLSGLSGPGAGRPAKVYRARGGIEVQIPERDYRLAGELLLEVFRRTKASVGKSEEGAAHDRGVQIGREARGGAKGRRSRRWLFAAAATALRKHGFDPEPTGRAVTLRNCPFDALATDYPETICQLNRAFLQGVLDGLGAEHLRAVATPRNGGCCAVLQPDSSSS